MKVNKKSRKATPKVRAGFWNMPKPVMIGAVATALVAAGVIFYINSSGGGGGVGDTAQFKGELIWVKCANPDCGAEYQMDKKEYYDYMQAHANEMAMARGGSAIPCKECEEKSLLRAVKCESCGNVFFRGEAERDFADRCPGCGYSATEERRKNRD